MDMTTTTDSEFIRKEVELQLKLLGLFPDICEIRALDLNGLRPAQAGFFDNLPACLDECARLDGQMNLYIGLQPKAGFSADNKIQPRRDMPKDSDITTVRSWVLDIDAVREKGLPASEEELNRVIYKTAEIAVFLVNQGFPKPFRMLTGNGVQIIMPLEKIDVREPAVREDVVNTLRDAEQALREIFEDARVRIDSIYNLSRIVRLAGSLNRKGTPSPERPWRRAQILWAPEEREEVSLDRVRKIAGLVQRRKSMVLGIDIISPMPVANSETLECCSAISRLWREGYSDRSKAIWGMMCYFAFVGVPRERAVAIIVSYNSRVVKKLGDQEAPGYAAYWYDRALAGKSAPTCSWFREIGYCPGMAQCDWGKHTLSFDDCIESGLINANVGIFKKEDKIMAWNPNQMAKENEIKTGEQKATVVEAYDGTSKKSGATMATVVFETDNGDRIYDHFVANHPVAKRRMLSLLAATGLADRDGEVETAELTGKRLILVVGVDNSSGLPQAKAERFLPLKEE